MISKGVVHTNLIRVFCALSSTPISTDTHKCRLGYLRDAIMRL